MLDADLRGKRGLLHKYFDVTEQNHLFTDSTLTRSSLYKLAGDR